MDGPPFSWMRIPSTTFITADETCCIRFTLGPGAGWEKKGDPDRVHSWWLRYRISLAVRIRHREECLVFVSWIWYFLFLFPVSDRDQTLLSSTGLIIEWQGRCPDSKVSSKELVYISQLSKDFLPISTLFFPTLMDLPIFFSHGYC